MYRVMEMSVLYPGLGLYKRSEQALLNFGVFLPATLFYLGLYP